MTWPNTTPITTANVDSGLDNPALARIQIKEAIENINAVVAEFSNVAITSAANGHIIQYNSIASQWQNRYPIMFGYAETVYTHTTTSGNITVDFENGNVQRIVPTGNLTLAYANFPLVGTVSLFIEQPATPKTVTFPATAKTQFGDTTLSTLGNVVDIIISSTYNTGSTYVVSIVKGFE